ncbi:GntR family transcriptional regulator [Affinirhizobium pseudoryzae]|jgi:DNA-binding GntR family transcriptional regulator|uniref:GntR family transcriptional regulator n=1 Tax=Allorhizobium pseudoryzae TaxID=379684 RepID=UPI0013EB28E0|nr:GntR family transcriptional regulator [Allorhizobium pseudoryzae]
MITPKANLAMMERPGTPEHTDSVAVSGTVGRVGAAYQAIKEAIRNNVFPPGYQAAEVEIARQLGMSRTPVHEAMARLQEDGLVRILPKKGILICALSPIDIEEIYEVIIAMEGAAAARIARLPADQRRSIADDLQTATDAMHDALSNDNLAAWAVADERFHETLVARCGNRRLMRMAGTVADQLHRARMFTLNLRPLPTASALDHQTIIDQIAKGHAEAASHAARVHRQQARDLMLPLIAKLNLRNL